MAGWMVLFPRLARGVGRELPRSTSINLTARQQGSSNWTPISQGSIDALKGCRAGLGRAQRLSLSPVVRSGMLCPARPVAQFDLGYSVLCVEKAHCKEVSFLRPSLPYSNFAPVRSSQAFLRRYVRCLAVNTEHLKPGTKCMPESTKFPSILTSAFCQPSPCLPHLTLPRG